MTTQEITVAEETKAPVKREETVLAMLDKMKPQMALCLPKHITPERMMRVTLTAIRNVPKLLECDRTSLFSAVMTCAQLGLEPDGVLGQAYLIPFNGRVQFIPGYRGLLSLARNSGEVVSIEAHDVHEKDKFDYAFGLNGRLEHVPASGERGAITHFWALARFKDGGYHYDVMSVDEVLAIRDKSQGYRAAVSASKKYNRPISSPWEDHFVEMGRKTAIRRIAKYLPMSVQKAVAIEAAYESGRSAFSDQHGDIVIEQTKNEETEQTNEVMQAKEPDALDAFEKE